MDPITKRRFTVAISCTGRFLENKPLHIHAIDHGCNSGEGGKFLFDTVAWPPATVAITPRLAAEFLRYGLAKLSRDLAESPKLANFFVGVPLSLAKSLVRKAEREYPDLDPFNHFVVEQLPYLPTTRLMGFNQIIARDRMRSSLELFHGLLWRPDWVEDPEFDPWRRMFRLERDDSHDRNLFEVHLGQTAQRYLQVRKSRGDPQRSRRRERLRKRFGEEHQVQVIDECRDLRVDEDLFDRGLMLLLAGLETQSKIYANEWNPSGEPVENDHGVWREGKVIVKSNHKTAEMVQPKWVCCLDKFNLQSIVREGVLPTKDLWKPGNAVRKTKVEADRAKAKAENVKSSGSGKKKASEKAHEAARKAEAEAKQVEAFRQRSRRSEKWSEVNQEDVVLLVQHSSWKAAAQPPKTVRRFVMIKVKVKKDDVPEASKSQFVDPWYLRSGSETSAGVPGCFEIEFLGFGNGDKLKFPSALLKEGPIIAADRFEELVKGGE
ncbi:MAG: hypothetical protein ACK6A7_11505 [Planctomycetota bacterium]|jgi:hypothetical protein